MKFLQTLVVFASLIFAPVYASDHEVLVAKNEVGGLIVLTTAECPIDQMKDSNISFTTFTNGIVYGCWFLYENMIHVAWVTPQGLHRATYDPSIFKVEKIA